MAVSRELWIAYTRIFFVELAYWVVSIGMVFINEGILNDSLHNDNLTVFVTTFQILFSLSILVTLNYFTKHYLYPSFNRKYDEVTILDDQDDDFEAETNYQNKNENEDAIKIAENIDPGSVSVSLNKAEVYRDNRHALLTNNEDGLKQEITIKRNRRLDEKLASTKAHSSGDIGQDDRDELINVLIVNIPERISLEKSKIVFPLSILYVGMLLLNNFCLKYVGVAFYFVSRSLTTVFNVIFTYFLINEPVSRGALVCCGFIVLGFILGVDQESVIGELSVIGVTFGVASSLFTSLFTIYTKKTLAKLDKSIWTLVLYNNINGILLCAPLMIVHDDLKSLVSDKIVSLTYWSLLSISGVGAFFISIVTNASIKYTSPLTHTISGTAKACLQTVIAVIYKQSHKSSLWWLSNLTILMASAFYSRIKQMDMERKASATKFKCESDSTRRASKEFGSAQMMASSSQTLVNGFGEQQRSNEFEGKRERRHSSSSSGCSETIEMIPSGRQNEGNRDKGSVVLFERSFT